MTKKLLIIPARIGSKRIKNKNIKKFRGKPIIEYSIETALNSKLFNEIHISTDSLFIKKITQKYSVNVDFLRPKKLSGDKIGLMDVFKFVVNKYKIHGKKFDEVWYLMPCAPLINSSDLVLASNYFKRKKTSAMLAVTEYSSPIQRAFKIDKNKKLTPYNKNKLKYRTQDLNKSYHDSGTFGMFKSNVFYKNDKISFLGYVIPRTKGVDIDNIDDWKFAEKIFQLNLNKN